MSLAIEWTVVEGAFSYTVQRSPAGGNSFVDIATDESGPVYIDTTNPSDFTLLYQVIAIDSKGDELGSNPTTPLTIYEVDETTLCCLSGRLVDATGRPLDDAEVRIYERPGDEKFYQDLRTNIGDDAHQFSDADDLIEASWEREVQTDGQGRFQIYLLRNKLFVVFEPRTKLKLWFMVPDQVAVGLHEIEGTFGYRIRIHNPF